MGEIFLRSPRTQQERWRHVGGEQAIHRGARQPSTSEGDWSLGADEVLEHLSELVHVLDIGVVDLIDGQQHSLRQ